MNTETFISTFLTNLRFQRSSFVQFSSCVTSASALNVSILTAIKPGQSVRSLVYTALGQPRKCLRDKRNHTEKCSDLQSYFKTALWLYARQPGLRVLKSPAYYYALENSSKS